MTIVVVTLKHVALYIFRVRELYFALSGLQLWAGAKPYDPLWSNTDFSWVAAQEHNLLFFMILKIKKNKNSKLNQLKNVETTSLPSTISKKK